MKKYFTTPIYYVNDVPHIGHAYCTLATDTLVRYWRKKLGRENVFFLTGTDENSQKTVDAARKKGESIAEYLEEMAANWRQSWEAIGIDFDDFIRTTEQRHVKMVQQIFHTIYDRGDIYKDKYTGLYCTGCETFLKASDLDENGNCPDHKTPPQKLQEENYFFRLSKYSEPLLKLYEENPSFLQPETRRKEITNFIRSGLEDVSISRETAEFGIPLPIDESHKVYVWFDALINYISGVPGGADGDFWKESVHIIGKDITRFHCVIWPAMLLSAGIKPAKEVFAHGFFTVDGQKMSKSLGNVVSPVELAAQYGNDALRAGLLGSFEFGHDGDFSLENFKGFYRMRLAGGVGNLFHRVITLIHKFLDGEKPKSEDQTAEMQKQLQEFGQLFEAGKIKGAIDYYFSIVDSANEILNKEEPWKLAKTDIEAAKKVFAILLQKLEVLAEMSQVILPETAPKMKKILGDEKKVGIPEILFEQKNTRKA
ncbi:methionine--tRNA ligase [Candidatus Gracilibacteria bacterium]|nr:methionine--tRNA ligase [Candidatus Gracilibacteria bacterium]MCF7819169.1 methionine--tRNA ligase [Candidatus Gracilibacteria bacterium]